MMKRKREIFIQESVGSASLRFTGSLKNTKGAVLTRTPGAYNFYYSYSSKFREYVKHMNI